MNDFLQEMTEDELESFIKSSMSGEEEYEKTARTNKRHQQAVGLVKKIESLLDTGEALVRTYEVPGKASEEAADIDKMLFKTKSIWEELFSMQVVTKESINEDSRIDKTLMDPDNISVEEIEKDIYKISLPIVLPNKKHRRFIPNYDNAYRMPIYESLRRAFSGIRPRYDEKVSVIISYTFPDTQKITDYDNIDTVHLLNCLASFFLIDDSPTFYNLHACGRVGEESRTDVYVMPEKSFPSVWKKISVS